MIFCGESPVPIEDLQLELRKISNLRLLDCNKPQHFVNLYVSDATKVTLPLREIPDHKRKFN